MNQIMKKRNYNFFRDPQISRLKGWICGPCDGAQTCAVGERLVGTCSHVATAIYIVAGLSYTPNWHVSTHVECNLLHRGMTDMAEETLSQCIG